MTRKVPIEDEDGLMAEDEMVPNLTSEQLQYQKIQSIESQMLSKNSLVDLQRVYSHPLISMANMLKRDGYNLKWVTFIENGIKTFSHIQEYLFKGYTLIPRDRLQNAPVLSDFGLDEVGIKYVTYKDAIAMEVPIDVDKAIQQANQAQADYAIKSLKGVKNDDIRRIGDGLMELDGSGRVMHF